MKIESGLAEGQVLQRVKNAAAATLAGTCGTNGPVTATVTAKGKPLPGYKGAVVGNAAGGRFSARLAKLLTGGPYKVVLKAGDESAEIKECWVGDVWLMAGQSNMEGIGNLNIAPKPHPQVRCLYMDGQWRIAEDPLHLLASSPDSVHAGNGTVSHEAAKKARSAGGKGAGVGVFFGKEMLARTRGVPQGLIATAHGGTSMAQWDPAKRDEGGKALYGSMYKLWKPTEQPVAGILWYQGESDCDQPRSRIYTQKMKELVAAFRKDLGVPKAPFFVVQIGRHTNGGPESGRWWEAIRDLQFKLQDEIPNLATIALMDLPLDDGIHIGTDGYAVLAKRLARQADRLVFGNSKEKPEPWPASAEAIATPANKSKTKDGVRITFKNVVGGLKATGQPTGFALVDMDGTTRTTHYRTTIDGNSVILHSDANTVGKIAGVLYGPGVNPYCNITDGRGCCLPAFGPLYITKGLKAITPFLPSADATEIQPAMNGGIASIPFPARGSLPSHRVESGNGFMNEHPRWDGKPGWAAFHFSITCEESMNLTLLLGYDGPFRLSIDGNECFKDMHGINPAIADSKSVKASLAAGKHDACVLMDLNGGKAWGFWFRACRDDIPAKRVPKRDFAMPVLSV